MKCPGCGGEMEPVEVVSVRIAYNEEEGAPDVEDVWDPSMFCPDCDDVEEGYLLDERW